MAEPVRVELRDHVLTVTIDRPERRNALTAAVNHGLLAALVRAGGDDDVRAVVVTGAGERAFCAGGDLSELSTETGAVEAHRARVAFADVLQALRRLPKPVIGRINGDALAGGFGLALGCDLLVAADHARFGTTEVRVGMWPYLITAVITEHLGPKRTLELMLTGRRLSAFEALEWGLLNRVVTPDDLDDAVTDLAGDLAGLSPVVLGLGKESYAVAAQLRRDDALAYLAGMLGLHLRTEDVVEGIGAFLEKRAPQWRGR
jgi:enoyl-CoA hydratase